MRSEQLYWFNIFSEDIRKGEASESGGRWWNVPTDWWQSKKLVIYGIQMASPW